MSWHRYAPAFVLGAFILISASLGPGTSWPWLALIAAAMVLQTRALWRLYRDG